MKGSITVTNDDNGRKMLIYAPNYEFSEHPTGGCYVYCVNREDLLYHINLYHIKENLEEVKDLIKKSHEQ